MTPPVTRKPTSDAPSKALGAGAAEKAPIATGAALAQRPKRPRKRFTIPSTVRDESRDPVSFVMQELTTGEIDMGYEAGGGNKNRVAAALAKLAIVKVDGKEASVDDVETAWPSWSEKVRQLAIQAYHRIHMTTDDEDAAFFASMADDDDAPPA